MPSDSSSDSDGGSSSDEGDSSADEGPGRQAGRGRKGGRPAQHGYKHKVQQQQQHETGHQGACAEEEPREVLKREAAALPKQLLGYARERLLPTADLDARCVLPPTHPGIGLNRQKVVWRV